MKPTYHLKYRQSRDLTWYNRWGSDLEKMMWFYDRTVNWGFNYVMLLETDSNKILKIHSIDIQRRLEECIKQSVHL